jgi:hypothetical protein
VNIEALYEVEEKLHTLLAQETNEDVKIVLMFLSDILDSEIDFCERTDPDDFENDPNEDGNDGDV